MSDRLSELGHGPGNRVGDGPDDGPDFESTARIQVDVEVVLVTFTTSDELDHYQRRREIPFRIVLDPDRSVYEAYGLGRGSFFQVWGWSTLRKYFSILKPTGPGRLSDLDAATEDTRQLGGDFVIAPDGRLAWGYWSTGPADRPSVDEIANAVRAATGDHRDAS